MMLAIFADAVAVTTAAQSQAQTQVTESVPMTWSNLVSVIVTSIICGLGLVAQSWWQRRVQRQDKVEVKKELTDAAADVKTHVADAAKEVKTTTEASNKKLDTVYEAVNGNGLMGEVKKLGSALETHTKDDAHAHRFVCARIGAMETALTGKTEVELHGPGGFHLPEDDGLHNRRADDTK